MKLQQLKEALVGKKITIEYVGGSLKQGEQPLINIGNIGLSVEGLFSIYDENGKCLQLWDERVLKELVENRIYTFLLDNKLERMLLREHRLYPIPPYYKYKVIYRIY